MVDEYFVSIVAIAVLKIFIILRMFVKRAGNTAFYSTRADCEVSLIRYISLWKMWLTSSFFIYWTRSRWN